MAGEGTAFPRTERESLADADDALEAFSALFLVRGWGDGLPFIPPTPERVERMAAGG